jgi:hypothetical protein
MFKNNLLFTRRLDNAYLFGILLTVTSIIEKLISQKEFITILISFVLVIFICFLGSILMVTKLKVKELKVDNSLNKISLLLYENAMYMHEKVGDYYVFKTRNFIIPNVSIFVKEYDKYCVILLNSKDAIWVEENLKKQEVL